VVHPGEPAVRLRRQRACPAATGGGIVDVENVERALACDRLGTAGGGKEPFRFPGQQQIGNKPGVFEPGFRIDQLVGIQIHGDAGEIQVR
jgi:hypothetical protein